LGGEKTRDNDLDVNFLDVEKPIDKSTTFDEKMGDEIRKLLLPKIFLIILTIIARLRDRRSIRMRIF